MSGMRDSRSQYLAMNSDQWRERAERAEAENVKLWKMLDTNFDKALDERVLRAEARVAELAEELRLTRAWREAWIEHYAKARDGKKRVEADRDAALDLLREVVARPSLVTIGWEERARAFLARVDSGTELK